MNLYGISINHKSSPIEIREALHLDDGEINNLIKILKTDLLSEGFIISTCNRTEIFGFPAQSEPDHSKLEKTLLDFKPVPGVTRNNFFRYYSCSALKHIYNVAAGLDSLMIGDSQILGQLKTSFSLAEEAGFVNTVMRKIFESAIKVGKRSISETNIGEGAITISYAAVQMLEKIFADLTNKSALVIGTGETGELALTHLKDKGVTKITVTNRTFSRAEIVAKKHAAGILPYEEFKSHLDQFDIIISATSANDFVLNYDDMKVSMKKRNRAPVCILDIAIPRDIDPKVSKLDNVFYNDIDSLNIIVNQNLEKRKKEIPNVDKIITEEMIALFNWYNTLNIVPTIKNLRKYFEDLRNDELSKIKNRMSPEDYDKVDDLTRRLLGRLLHYPTMKLRTLAESGDNLQEALNYSNVLQDLYNLKDSTKE